MPALVNGKEVSRLWNTVIKTHFQDEYNNCRKIIDNLILQRNKALNLPPDTVLKRGEGTYGNLARSFRNP